MAEVESTSEKSKRPAFKGEGRRKIEIKKIDNKRRKWVTLSKRKKGLFKKAAQLSQVSGEDFAVLVISEQGRVYKSDNADVVFGQYLSVIDGDESGQTLVNAAAEGKPMVMEEEEEGVARIEGESGVKLWLDLNKLPEEHEEFCDD